MSNIALITPPSPFLLDERVFMHIGILKVAAALEAAGYEIDFLDLAGVDQWREVIATYVTNYEYTRTFGITATTPQIPFALQISKYIKELAPAAKVILGGTHSSLMHSAMKKEKNGGRATKDIEALLTHFNVLVAGDGEKAIFEALKLDKGIVDADLPKSDLFLTNEELTQLPLPSRHLVDMDSYHYDIEGAKATSLICQLGCPFKCTFCGGRNSPFLRRIRTRTSDSVVAEVKYLHKTYGFTGFMFYDDELNVSKEWETLLENLVALQKELNTSFMFRGFVKAELFTQRQADLMYQAGFRWLLTGFEAGDERILVNIDKNADVAANTRCIQYAKNAGLKIKALMSLGHAGESRQTIANTKNWLLETKPEDFDCTIITTYPGSPYFDDAVLDGDKYVYTQPKTGDKLYQKNLDYLEKPDYYKGDPEGGYHSYVWTDYLTPEELVEERDALEKEVREVLSIPFNPAGGFVKFEHSMGQGNIPNNILRNTNDKYLYTNAR
jgi:anaerobic magnesium-protoporphyrin IX monomethyl ester cyclase